MSELTVRGVWGRFLNGLSTYSRDPRFALPCIPHGAAYISVARNSDRIVIAVLILARLCGPVYTTLSLRCGEQKRQNPGRVNHWQTILAIIAVSASIVVAEDFKTINGKEYKNATVSRIEPDGIVLKSKSGITKLYFTELPKDVQERFHYDSAQSAHFTADREATAAQENGAFAEHPLGATADQFVGRYG